MEHNLMLEIIVGIITSFIGSAILISLRPPYVYFDQFDSDLLLWLGVSLICLAIGTGAAVLGYAIGIELGPYIFGVVPGLEVLVIPFSILYGIGLGILVMVLVYRRILG